MQTKKSKFNKIIKGLKYKEVKAPITASRYDILQMLYNIKNIGSFYCVFNGEKFYSDKITLKQVDSERLKFLRSMSNDDSLRTMIKKQEEEIAKAELMEKISAWVVEGSKYIKSNQVLLWKSYVKTVADFWGSKCGQYIEGSLRLLKALNIDKSFNDAKKIFEGKNSSSIALYVNLEKFCENGKAFYQYLNEYFAKENKYNSRQEKQI